MRRKMKDYREDKSKKELEELLQIVPLKIKNPEIIDNLREDINNREYSLALEKIHRILDEKDEKKKKDDDGTADPKFLAKRFVTYFPELREEIKNEEDCYFPFRGATFAKEHIAPKIPMYIKRANKNEIEKFANVFNVQYNNGDVDTRAIITIVLLNSLDDAEYNALYEHFNDELKVAALNARAFKGKTVKPEKVKKVKAKANTLTNN